MALRLSKIRSVNDDPTHPLRIQPSDFDLTTLPADPLDLDLYLEITGEQPNLGFSLQIYYAGEWHAFAAVQD